jgi:hypothetical protein
VEVESGAEVVGSSWTGSSPSSGFGSDVVVVIDVELAAGFVVATGFLVVAVVRARVVAVTDDEVVGIEVDELDVVLDTDVELLLVDERVETSSFFPSPPFSRPAISVTTPRSRMAPTPPAMIRRRRYI